MSMVDHSELDSESPDIHSPTKIQMKLDDFQIVEMAPPHNNSVWVKSLAEIRKIATGEVKDYKYDAIWDEGTQSPDTYIWREGNFSCDCNRAIFFDEEDDQTCSEGRFDVNLKNPRTGEYFYKEFN